MASPENLDSKLKTEVTRLRVEEGLSDDQVYSTLLDVCRVYPGGPLMALPLALLEELTPKRTNGIKKN